MTFRANYPSSPGKAPAGAKPLPPTDARDKIRLDVPEGLVTGVAGRMEHDLIWHASNPTHFTGTVTLTLELAPGDRPRTLAAHWWTETDEHLALMVELDWSGDGPRVAEARIADVAEQPPHPTRVPASVFRFRVRPPGAPDWIRAAIDVLTRDGGYAASAEETGP